MHNVNHEHESFLPSQWAKSESKVTKLCPTLCDPMTCSLPGISVHGILQAIKLEWVAISFSRDLPGIEPTLKADTLTSEPRGKPKNTGAGCHACLQGIFPTEGSNQGHPRYKCGRILNHLSHQGSPKVLCSTDCAVWGSYS